MRRQLWLGFLGILALTVGCSSQSDTEVSQITLAPESAGASKPQEFAKPLVKPSFQSAVVPTVPGLLRSTNPKARAESVPTGRQDPFAAIPTSSIPITITTARTPTRNVAIAPLPAGRKGPGAISTALPPIQLPPLRSTPSAAPLPDLAGSSSPLPPLSIPAAPEKVIPPSPTALAESVEVSGVVQVAGKWNVIVKEPSASSSRYVAVGDYVENGRVLVKKIVSPGSTEPVVILQQDGVEIRKYLA